MSAQESSEELVSFSEVAKAARVHPRTLERWAEAGKIPKPMKLQANGRRVYTASELATIVSFARATVPG
jgi:DNA-binding transcriptional MerR regulator